ncbi:CRISPR-associated endonuclease Cas1 [Candidatus Bathyarchaeota archaeon]|nr:CRISPR-associated endonuclease Cas1 [Candidatus Bathyarchaeota archaeon]
MNILYLDGYGIKINTKNLKRLSLLTITNGRNKHTSKQETHEFSPRKIPYDSIIIDGHSGYISLQAFHWLSKNNIPVFVMDFDGTVLSNILPPTPVKVDVKLSQIKLAFDRTTRFIVAKALIQAKIIRSLQVLDWLAERYDITEHQKRAQAETLSLFKAKTVSQIRTAEGRVALRYWQAIKSTIPECFTFDGRTTGSHNNNAVDPINLTLNYAYGVLEGYCRKAINTVGLEPSIGFLHKYSDYQTKQSLVYDLQEPFRWIADITTLEAFESGVLDLKDFYFFGNDYRYRIEVEAKRRFLKLFQEKFNSGAKYKGGVCKWDTIILRKTQELSRYLSGKTKKIDFAESPLKLERNDTLGLRKRIMELTEKEARELGIGKSTLHYLRKNARSNKSFKTYRKVAQKLLPV